MFCSNLYLVLIQDIYELKFSSIRSIEIDIQYVLKVEVFDFPFSSLSLVFLHFDSKIKHEKSMNVGRVKTCNFPFGMESIQILNCQIISKVTRMIA